MSAITFHAKLGSQHERVERLQRLAGEIARIIGADVDKARLAARLAKADLVTGMVGEFPELQGIMGGYYARAEGLDDEVAAAIRDHYKPQGPSDSVPEGPVAQAVALADKLDTLVGFWAIDEKPTGSKDPYALRRAALGIIRIIVEQGLRLGLLPLLRYYSARIDVERFYRERETLLDTAGEASEEMGMEQAIEAVESHAGEMMDVDVDNLDLKEIGKLGISAFAANAADLLAFFADRLKVHLREQGTRHDLIDAIFSLGGQDDLLMIVRRVEALGRFLDSDDGKNLLAGVKRATNILRIEEKKDGRSYDGAPDPKLLLQGEEKELHRAIGAAAANARKAVAEEDFEAAMRAMARLRAPVDEFFDKVTVNADDPSFRENRLKLLSRIRAATLAVADFSRIEG